MDRIIQVLIVFLAGAVIGGLSWERYQLREANSEWSGALDRAQKATDAALAAERRLANAQARRDQAERNLETAVNASDSDCPVPDDEQQLLNDAAEETRADRSAGLSASKVQR